jgi:cytidine deaminase
MKTATNRKSPRSALRSGQPKVTPARLMAEAERARRNAYAPYSRFLVGAALLTADGRVIHGCNVENASLGLSICAERNAMWKAVGEGERDFVAVAVTAGKGHAASPCGSCRQVLHEFAPGLWVYWRDARGRILKRRLRQLLDHAFDLKRGRAR